MFSCVEYEVLCKQNIINILAIKAFSNYINSQLYQSEQQRIKWSTQSKSVLQQKPIVRAEFPASTSNSRLVTCTLSNIKILCSLRSACYYFQYWWEIPPCFNFYIVTHSYSSHPFLCALGRRDWLLKSNQSSCVLSTFTMYTKLHNLVSILTIGRIAKLSADYNCSSIVPRAVTDCSPLLKLANLHPSFI